MKNFFIVALLSVIFTLFYSCKQEPRKYSPGQVNFSATYNPNFDNMLYPSLIVGFSNYDSGKELDDFFKFSLKSPTSNAVLRIKIEETPLNFETIFQAQLPSKDEEYTFSPIIKWKYDKLKDIQQQGTVDFTFTCFINDEEVDVKNIRLNYRSINECVLGVLDSNNTYIDYKWMLAAYVNEDHYMIDFLLKEMLEQDVAKRFVGYQGTQQEVKDQVFAIWYYLQNKGVKYSSIARTSGTSKRVFSQYVRFFDQVYSNQQANCIDGCIFFSSILKRIGLDPFLVGEPGHMYLGIFRNPDKKEVYLLETTLIGEVDLSQIPEKQTDSILFSLAKYKKYLSPKTLKEYEEREVSLVDVKKEISKSIFQKALDYDIKKYNSNLSKINDPQNTEYHFYDIVELRKKIQPIGR